MSGTHSKVVELMAESAAGSGTQVGWLDRMSVASAVPSECAGWTRIHVSVGMISISSLLKAAPTDERDFALEAWVPVAEEAIDAIGIANDGSHHRFAVMSAGRG